MEVNHFCRAGYHAKESFVDESSVDDHAFSPTKHFLIFDWCVHRSFL